MSKNHTTQPKILTRHKRNLAQHNPAQRKVQIQLHESADAIVQFDGHVASVLHHQIGHVRVADRLAAEMHAAQTEEDLGVSEHLYVLAEHVVRVDDDRAEIPYAVELEHDLDGLTGTGQ